jgi:hypothetical protein
LFPELANTVFFTQDPLQKLHLFEGIARLLCLSRAQLLVLDDAHWADPGTLELIHFLVSWLRSPERKVKLLVVVTYAHASLIQETGHLEASAPLEEALCYRGLSRCSENPDGSRKYLVKAAERLQSAGPRSAHLREVEQLLGH